MQPQQIADFPSLLRDGDEIEISIALPGEYGQIFQLIAGADEPTIFLRPRRSFRAACYERRVYKARLKRTELMVGAIMFVPKYPMLDDRPQEEEIASVLVHPRARGFRIASWLLQAAMVNRLATEHYDDLPSAYERRWYAKVLRGNAAPHHALCDAGFRRAAEPEQIDPTNFGGALDHMLKAGERFIFAYRYDFDLDTLDSIIVNLLKFIRDRAAQEKRGSTTLTFQFDKNILPVEALEYHVSWLTRVGRLSIPPAVA